MKWLWHLDQYYLSDCSYFRVSHKTSLKVTLDWSKRRNGFQSGGTMEYWKGMSATMVGRQGKSLNSRRSRMAKIVTFWPGWQPFDSFCFETLSFFPFFPYFLFDTKKSRGPWPPGPPGVAGPVFRNLSNIWDGPFSQNNNDSDSLPVFCKKLHLRCLRGFWIRLWEKNIFGRWPTGNIH